MSKYPLCASIQVMENEWLRVQEAVKNGFEGLVSRESLLQLWKAHGWLGLEAAYEPSLPPPQLVRHWEGCAREWWDREGKSEPPDIRWRSPGLNYRFTDRPDVCLALATCRGRWLALLRHADGGWAPFFEEPRYGLASHWRGLRAWATGRVSLLGGTHCHRPKLCSNPSAEEGVGTERVD